VRKIFCKKKEKKKASKKKDQTRFSSFMDLIFVPFTFPPEPFRSLKYSIGTIAKKKIKIKMLIIKKNVVSVFVEIKEAKRIRCM
jgi:hypothetical protein